ERVTAAGWRVVNLDCTIFAQRPKLAPYKPAIRQRLAELLVLDASAVNGKAKTGEHVRPVGDEEAMEAGGVVALQHVTAGLTGPTGPPRSAAVPTRGIQPFQSEIRNPRSKFCLMPLRVYNTLTRTKEDFQTVVPGKVGMYLCGPTVYKPAHIGHMVG